MRKHLLVLALVVIAGVQHAQAQHNEYKQQVDSLLRGVEAEFSSIGYVSTHDFYIDGIDPNTTGRFTVDLKKGREYALTAVCDSDCSDVDIEVYDDNGNEIVTDNADDDYPTVTLTPNRTSRFTIEVTMASCSRSPCYYGVATFGK